MDNKELALKAVEAKITAHTPYSGFNVGSAILTEDGKVYKGGNIESSSYSLTICAERTALFKAYSEGERKFKAIAVSGDSPDFCPPCGSCRQVLWDLCGDIDVVMINQKEELKVLKLSELLPLAFGDNTLK